MGPYLTLLFLATLVALQTTVMGYASLGTAKPLLPLLAVVAWGLVRGPLPGLWWALACGVLLDLETGSPGFYTTPLLAASGVVALSRGRMFPSNFLLPGVVGAAATAVFLVVQRALVAFQLRDLPRVPEWSFGVLAEDVVPVVALNLLWLPVLYFPLRRLAGRIGSPRMGWER